MSPRAGSFAPLGERPFRLLFLGRTLSSAGDAIVPVAVTFAVLELGGAAELGLVLGCHWASRVLFLIAGGVWADRLPRQLVMMAADVVRAVVQGLLAVAFFVDAVEIWHLAVGQALFGAASAFFNPAATGLVPHLVSAGHLQQANALLGLSRNAVQIGGPVASGVLVATVGFGVVFLVDALTFVASFVCLTAMRLPKAAVQRVRQSLLRDALDGLRVVRERQWLVVTLCCDFVVNIALGAYFVLGPVVAEEHYGGVTAWGFILTATAIGSVVAGAAVLRVKPRRPLLVAYAFGFTVPIELLVLAPPAPFALAVVGAGGMFAAIVVLNTFYSTMQQQHVPTEALSRVDSLGLLASFVGMPAAMIAAGPVAGEIGVEATLVAAAALASAALVVALSSGAVRNLTRLDAIEASSVRTG